MNALRFRFLAAGRPPLGFQSRARFVAAAVWAGDSPAARRAFASSRVTDHGVDGAPTAWGASEGAPRSANRLKDANASKARHNSRISLRNQPCGGSAGPVWPAEELDTPLGKSRTRRAAIPGASDGFTQAGDTLVIIAARASVAASRGSCASLPASAQGSRPSRASPEATVSGMPFSCSPIEEKRKGSKFALRREKRADRAISLYLWFLCRMGLLLKWPLLFYLQGS